ncbi:MAG: hypothetical protein CMJ31_05330 [Phycisphaerae bacterium]|nr:hypothetical protein [Phycisphaerae bacterium]
MFGRNDKKKTDPPAGDAEQVHASQHVVAERRGRVINATLQPETVSEHESRILLEELGTLCLEQASSRLAIGLDHVTVLTSAGIGMLVQLHKKLSADGGGIAVYGLNDDLSHLMKLTRMDKLFTIKPDADEAVAALV